MGQAMVRTRQMGNAVANRGLNIATTPGVSTAKSFVGKGMHAAGNAVAAHPGKTLAGAGALGAMGAVTAGKKMLGGGQQQG